MIIAWLEQIDTSWLACWRAADVPDRTPASRTFHSPIEARAWVADEARAIRAIVQWL
jgi:hypothetical protein